MPEKNLVNRTFDFAVAVGKLVTQLPYDLLNRQYFAQIIRSSASVGANYRASQRAKSSQDFINKLKIVEEEADETLYFLQLILEFNPTCKKDIVLLIDECVEIVKIVVASINTTRRRLINKKNS
jgi:four helix bundle protein